MILNVLFGMLGFSGRSKRVLTICLLSATIQITTIYIKIHKLPRLVKKRMESLKVNDYQNLLEINNYTVQIVNTIFGHILQYVLVLCYYFILFDNKISLDINRFNK